MTRLVAMRTDQELLAAYAATGEESAFAELVARHGRMIFRTCQRALGSEHDAEEAAQAVFLVLARKARALRSEGELAAWLHRVARNVAHLALRSRARRSRHEAEAAMVRETQDEGRGAMGGSEKADVAALLDRELDALPTAQRQAVLLRYLEGHSVEEAARMAGCPSGTLGWRASEGLERLRQRLCSRGQVLSAAALAALLGAETAAAAPASLLPSILLVPKLAAAGAAAGAAGGTASLLAEGVVKMMFWAKVKVAAAVCAAVLAVGGGGGAMAVKLLAAEPSVPKAQGPMPNAQPDSGVTEKGISCQVTALPGGGKVVLNAGSEQGLKPGFELDVERDGKKVAMLKVTVVEPKTATAELVSATGELKVGDRAATRFREVVQPTPEPGKEPPAGGEAMNGLRVVLSARKVEHKLGERWEFDVKAVNVGNESVTLDYYDQTIRLEITGPAGPVARIPDTRTAKAERPPKEVGHFAVVAPGIERDLSGSSLSNFRFRYFNYAPGLAAAYMDPDSAGYWGGWPRLSAGEYRVKAVLENKGPDDTGKYGIKAKEWLGAATSNEVRVTVLPPEGAGVEKPAAGAPDEATARRLVLDHVTKVKRWSNVRPEKVVKVEDAGDIWKVSYDPVFETMPPIIFSVNKASGAVSTFWSPGGR